MRKVLSECCVATAWDTLRVGCSWVLTDITGLLVAASYCLKMFEVKCRGEWMKRCKEEVGEWKGVEVYGFPNASVFAQTYLAAADSHLSKYLPHVTEWTELTDGRLDRWR